VDRLISRGKLSHVFYFISKTFNIVEAQVQSDEIYEKAVMEFRKREHVTFVDNPVECF
jgi:hypothetical protein